MQKSFIDRIFPSTQQPILPQHHLHKSTRYTDHVNNLSSPASVPNLSLSPVSTRQSTSSRAETSSTAPLNASIIHYADPFVPVERAARALQNTIQSLLDNQADALKGRTSSHDGEELTSTGSCTPTPSTITPAASASASGAVPVRQPKKGKMSLRTSRRALGQSMREFAKLREEELHIIDQELQSRNTAISRAHDFGVRKEAVEAKIRRLQQNTSLSSANALRTEAANVEKEIYELETKLLELKVRKRHLLDQATQLENTAESELSSFKGAWSQIQREEKRFLMRPPITHELSIARDAEATTSMYDLKPERRTVEMAEEQWKMENQILERHREDVQAEQDALMHGEKLWQESLSRIAGFERLLKKHLASLAQTSYSSSNVMTGVGETALRGADSKSAKLSDETLKEELMSTARFLQEQLAYAETNRWNLLVCALGAELEAFWQAQNLLGIAEDVPDGQISEPAQSHNSSTLESHGYSDDDGPSPDLLRDIDVDSQDETSSFGFNRHTDQDASTGSHNSNESLQTTLKEVSASRNGTRPHDMAPGSIERLPRPQKTATLRSESSDDDPGPDFLLSN